MATMERLGGRDRIATMAIWLATLLFGNVTARCAALAAEPGERSSVSETTQITKEGYHGWPNTYRLANAVVEVRVVTDIGPRIVELRLADGANLLHVRAAELGGRGEPTWMFRGGWRLWIAPEKTETTYALDNTPCTAEIVNDTTLRVTGPPQPAAGIRKEVEVRLAPGESRLQLTSRIQNISDRPLTYAAWSLPVLRPGGRAFVPLDVGSLTAFDATRKLILWSYTEMNDPRYRWGDRLIEIDHAQVKPAPAGQRGRRDDESKIGVDSAQGWEAYLLDGTLFLKRFAHEAGRAYPDGGATIEVYSSHEFLELEHLGPLTTIAPGAAIVFPEDWWLFTAVTIPSGEAPALAALHAYVDRAPLDAGRR
jgi:hypothetical protein